MLSRLGKGAAREASLGVVVVDSSESCRLTSCSISCEGPCGECVPSADVLSPFALLIFLLFGLGSELYPELRVPS